MKENRSNSVKKIKIGELLIKEGLLTHAELIEVLKLQKEQKLYSPLGELCVSQKFVSRSDLTRVLGKYRKSIPLGELLLNLGIITSEQLEYALELQKTTPKKIGQILIEMEIISESTLVDALSLQLGIPKILPSLSLIDKSLLGKFNPEFLHKHKFIPAFSEDDKLIVIMADPLDETAINLFQKILKRNIIPAIAPAFEIQKTINEYCQKLELGQGLESQEHGSDIVIGNSELHKNRSDNIIEVLNFIISNATLERATDIHIEPHDNLLRIRFRIDGILYHKTDLPRSMAPKLGSRIKALCNLDIAEKRRHQDGRIHAKIMDKEYDLRISTYAAIWGENIVIRLQNRQSNLFNLNMLGFSPNNLERFKNMLDLNTGIILVTGPTGCGKTTTLYASLNYLNELDRVIITIEDPVEYTINGVIQANIQPKIGVDYEQCLKAMMRQDPDVLMIGEIREPESAEAVVQAALTGHKVFSTFHTDDACGALLRLIDMGIETFLISSTLVAVVAQRLVRVLCKHCKEKYKPGLDVLSFFHSIKTSENDEHKFFKHKGCIKCNNNGYKGLTAIHEVLTINDVIREAILNRSTSNKIRSIARREAGLLTMSEDGYYKALKGITTLEEVRRVVYQDDCKGINPITQYELITKCGNGSN